MAVFTGNFHSEVLRYETSVRILLPDVMPETELKVLYLLHGRGDDACSWTRFCPLERYVEQMPLAVVMPTGEDGFYTDSVGGKRYFTFLTQELPEKIEEWFLISRRKEDTYIAGLSMGAYGAMKAAFTYPERYQNVGAFSAVTNIAGLVDSLPDCLKEDFTENVERVFGSKIRKEDELLTRLEMANKQEKEIPSIQLYVGTEDFFYEANQEFVQKLKLSGCTVDYEEWSGGHEWNFWDKAIQKFLKKLPFVEG